MIVIAALAGLAESVGAQLVEHDLRYEAIRYGSMLNVLSHHVILERIDPKQLDVTIFSYRLDRKEESGQAVDSLLFGRNSLEFGKLSEDSIESLRINLLNSPTAKVLLDHTLEYLGQIDTIAGLPSYEFSIQTEGNREYLIWLAAAPPGFEKLLLWQSIEYPGRSGSFMLEEELCNMIRLILLRGIEFPPGADSDNNAFMITRFDTAVNPDFLNARDNSYLYELKGITVDSSSTD